MSTNNKTLADVQPGGRVRLPQAGQFDSELLWWLMDAASTLSEGGNESHAERLRSLHAALSAQPSTGGQGALKALDDLAAFCSDDTETVERHVAVIRAALAARQPVGEPVGTVGKMPGTDGFTMACFKADEVPVGSRLYAAPPAQETAKAVDLEQFREAVEVALYDAELRLGSCYHEGRQKHVDKLERMKRLLALIDSNSNS